MVIVAISYIDVYTCSSQAYRADVDPTDVESVYAYVLKDKKLPRGSVNELIVIENDHMFATYALADEALST